MWNDGASAGSLLSWSRLTRYSRHTQLVPQSCRAGRDTHKQKARKERGMSRDKLTHGDMHTRKIRAKAVITKMDSSTVLPTWKRRTGLILVLFMGEIKDITVYYARKHKTPAILTPRHQCRQTSEQTSGCGKKHIINLTRLVPMDKESDTCQRIHVWVQSTSPTSLRDRLLVPGPGPVFQMW